MTALSTGVPTRTPAWRLLWHMADALREMPPESRAPRLTALIADQLDPCSRYTGADLAYAAAHLRDLVVDFDMWEHAEPTVEVTLAVLEEARANISADCDGGVR